ncbi:MAG: DUF5106 domain-containing protein [Muribaculaceae bacterium]|nr:DUF5106 domain-containing protein [Muribaculaceae bacterium]MDE5845389.1 DUF5106 domain-containing protein [Muribaculaceae bacterium]
MRLRSSIYSFIVSLCIYVTVASCSMSAKNSSTSDTNINATASAEPELQLPDIPKNLTVPQERAAYLLLHYWDNMNWTDSSLINNDYFMEQNMSTYFDLFNHVSTNDIAPAVDKMIELASVNPDAIEKICSISDLYLYDTQSPVMNEKYYRIIVESLLNSKKTSDYRSIILQATLNDLSKNAVGYPASSFNVTTRDDKKTNLSQLLNKSGRTILFFYDPDCEDCALAESLMQSNATINSAIAEGSLKIVAICPFTVENNIWSQHATTLPKTWTVGYSPNGQVDEEGIYVFRAYPTIYLIDSNGVVLSKDITYDTLKELI